MNYTLRSLPFVFCLWLLFADAAFSQEQPPLAELQVGPQTENRFPPLQVVDGFSATLFACDPLIEFPSVIALGPRADTLFVANDYVKGMGREIARRDDIRLIEDTDGDGYADRAVVFADEFNSIQGLEFYDGALFVMHAPLLTVLRDADGDGKADSRRDLLDGLGLPPEENPSRLHCANGVVAGYDGWLYLAMGDNGCEVKRPEGDRLVFHGGGILRCRRDGTDLHLFSQGMRNIYDVALDDSLNVFVRDNENDGGDFMIRVCHSFFGADHGYPYLYRDHPDEALAPIADMGRGSSAGGVCYRETQFPPEMRGDLFFCEWGRAVVRCRPQRQNAGFGPVKEHDFAHGHAEDPYGFKPTDIVIERDGSMMVSDWADGQSTRRGRGRIYRIRRQEQPKSLAAMSSPSSIDQALDLLNSPSSLMRDEAQLYVARSGDKAHEKVSHALQTRTLNAAGRRRAVWLLTTNNSPNQQDQLFEVLQNDPDPTVRLQAVRAIADSNDPVLVHHRLDAGRGDGAVARRLASAAASQTPAVQLEIVVAFGRLRWSEAPEWITNNLGSRPTSANTDMALSHAVMQTLRRADNWSTVIKLLDGSTASFARRGAVRALAEQAQPVVVDRLIERLESDLKNEIESTRAQEYADLLARIWKKPPPWKYWGYRPPPRPANTEAWERTTAIETALDRALQSFDEPAYRQLLARLRREEIPTQAATVLKRLRTAKSPQAVADLLTALAAHPADVISKDLSTIVLNTAHSQANRQTALSMLVNVRKPFSPTHTNTLTNLAASLEDGPVLAETLRTFADHQGLEIKFLLRQKLSSPHDEVRAAAVYALGRRHKEQKDQTLGPDIAPLLDDKTFKVRMAAAQAVADLRFQGAAARLADIVVEDHGPLAAVCYGALTSLKDDRAVEFALKTLKSPDSKAETCLAAVEYLAVVGDSACAGPLASYTARQPTRKALGHTIGALSRWAGEELDRPKDHEGLETLIAQVQGQSGEFLRWKVEGPFSPGQIEQRSSTQKTADAKVLFTSESGQLSFPSSRKEPPHAFLAATHVHLSKPTSVRFHVSSRDQLAIWVNGKQVFEQSGGGASIKSDVFDAELPTGKTRVKVRLESARSTGSLELRFREKTSRAEHERLAQLALRQKGDSENGRRLFLDLKKTQCLKCHHMDQRGEKIGPDLTGVGRRFSRIHLVESILQPSRHVAPAYRTMTAALGSGKVMSGVVVEQNEKEITLADREGKRHVIAREDIESHAFQEISTMPEGLEKQFTSAEFVDLIAFLVSQKSQP